MANTILVNFVGNTLVFTNDGIGFPLYSSYNRSFDDNIVFVNGYRRLEPFSLSVLAVGYARVPNTQRYVITYINQKFANNGIAQGFTLFSERSTHIDTEKFEVGTYSNQTQSNILYSKNFKIKLRDPNNNGTKFYTVSQDSNGVFESNYSISSIQQSGNYDEIKNYVGADSGRDDKKSNYLQIQPGYYIFINSDRIVHFPTTASYQTIDDALVSSVNSKGEVDTNKLSAYGATVYNGQIVQDAIYTTNYNIVLKKNVKIDKENIIIMGR